jgi:hypothetical protein
MLKIAPFFGINNDVFDTKKGGLIKKPTADLLPNCLFPQMRLFDSKKGVLRPKNGLVFRLMP